MLDDEIPSDPLYHEIYVRSLNTAIFNFFGALIGVPVVSEAPNFA